MASSIMSVSSMTTNNTYNTCNTGDGTVQVSNKQKSKLNKRHFPKRSSISSIVEEPIYDLSRSSDGSFLINKLSDSGSMSSATKSRSMNRKDIMYDLSGEKSTEELRRDFHKSLTDMEKKVREEETVKGGNGGQDSSWINFLFCYNNDTTMNETSTHGTTDNTDSDSCDSAENENGARQSLTAGTNDAAIYDLSGGKPPRSKNRRSKVSAQTAMLIANAALKDPSLVKPRTKSLSKSLSKKKRIDTNITPQSPTRLEPGAESLDIVMELQLDEDLMIGKKEASKKSKPIFKKKVKQSKTSNSAKTKTPKAKNLSKKTKNNGIQSVRSETSLFSFESSVKGKQPQEVKRNTTNVTSNLSRRGKIECIAGPVNGTFLHITPKKNPDNPEIADTYNRFRVFENSVDMVLSRFITSIPLYHWKGIQTFKFGHIHESASSEDLELGSFGSLDLKSPSMMTNATETSVPVSMANVCSEPSAKGFQVRGKTYPKDGKKCSSGEGMFALLGADSVMKCKKSDQYIAYDVSKAPGSYLSKLAAVSKSLGLKSPFLLLINFVVPWGNLLSYYYRPDCTNGGPFNESRKSHASEKQWKAFMEGDDAFKNKILKFIPRVIEGPWALKKLVGNQPGMIGQKIPTKYYGSIEDGYLEICMDVTKGGKMANSICSAVASKATAVSIDLAFLLQGVTSEELPEQILSVIRLHHVSLKKKVTRIEI